MHGGLPALTAIPVIDLLAGLVLVVAVALLKFSLQLLLLAGDDVEIIVRELAPLLLDLAVNAEAA
jgi:hypothetical protein